MVINHSRIPQLSPLMGRIRWSGTPVTLSQAHDSLFHSEKNKLLSDTLDYIKALHGSRDALPCPHTGSLTGGDPSSSPSLHHCMVLQLAGKPGTPAWVQSAVGLVSPDQQQHI